MLAKIKTPVFIDFLSFELLAPICSTLRAILRDEKGTECSRMEADVPKEGDTVVTWKGLNDLPYGVYTLEIFGGTDETKLKIVKRI